MQPDFKDAEYRKKAFCRVFGTPEGKDVLAWLKTVTHLKKPDFECASRVYYELGRLSVIGYIEDTINYERKEACQKNYNP